MSLKPWLPVPITPRLMRLLGATVPESPSARPRIRVGNANAAPLAAAVSSRKSRRDDRVSICFIVLTLRGIVISIDQFAAVDCNRTSDASRAVDVGNSQTSGRVARCFTAQARHCSIVRLTVQERNELTTVIKTLMLSTHILACLLSSRCGVK